MPILADNVDIVIGVDSHRDNHVAAIIDPTTGAVLDDLTIVTDGGGYQQLLAWAKVHCPDGLAVWAVEGCGSYAAGLTRHLQAAGEWVVEVERPARPVRQQPAKTDLGDAIRAAREVLGRDIDQLATPRQGTIRDSLAVLLMARRGAVDAGADAQRQLHAAILTAPDALRQRFTTLSTTAKIRLAAGLRPDSYTNTATGDHARALQSIATRCQHNHQQAADLKTRITRIVTEWRPDLLELTGVGPVTAAGVLCAWSHPTRFRSDAAFAMCAGTAPIPASSGLTTRHRLNPGGDRQLNRHIHTIALTRLRCDPETIAYRDRRRAEGKTDREIRRCIKRYITRQLFRQLQHPPT